MPFTKSHKKSYTRDASKSLGNGKGKILFKERRILIEGLDGTEYYVFSLRWGDYIHGDIVEYEITRKAIERKLPEARPIKLIQRSKEELLMQVEKKNGKILFRLSEISGTSIVRPIQPIENPEDGDIYVVRFRERTSVDVLRYFGSREDTEVIEKMMYFRAWVRHEWPEKLRNPDIAPLPSFGSPDNTAYTQPLIDGLIPDEKKLSDTDIFPRIMLDSKKNPRFDLRLWPTLTIDGADAKDLDDAISMARYEWGDFLLGVHIADVAEYVTEGSDLDTEAYLRGTSIYTPGRVIPMLPEILSNDRCSLHPGGPKLTLSILIRIDPNGKVKESCVTESIIESQKKGIYDEIWEEMKGWQLQNFSSLYTILEKRRAKEWKILFETTECYFDLDADRHVKNIRKRSRNDAHMMIEEFMVLANEEVAKWCQTKGIPFLSRVHDAPSAEKTREIHEIIAIDNPDRQKETLSVDIDTELTPRAIRHILEWARARGDLYRFSRLLLPKMSKAIYQDKKHRHFGLALEYYAHFTSPIRRYPDLLLHRMIKKYLHSELGERKSEYVKNMKKWGISLSEKERTAEEISRSIDSLYMCRYMSQYVWQSFDGIVSWLTESNIYIELNSGVEGSIYIGKGAVKRVQLRLDSSIGALIDTKWITVYIIGQSLRVKIREVDIGNRRIEMEAV